MEDSSGETKCSRDKLHRKQMGRWEAGAEDVETEAELRRKNRWPTPDTELGEQTEARC